MKKIVWSTTCLLLAHSIVACSGGAGGETSNYWQAVTDTVADTITVRTISGSVWGDTAYLEPEVSIGMLEGPDEYLIGNPRSLAVSDDGVIFMLDRQVPVIRAYGPDGNHLFDVGREGGGPGEYKSPGAIALLSDGRLLVRDPANNRISIFGSDGQYLEHVRYPGGFNTGRRLYVDTSDVALSLVLMNYGTAPWDWEFGLVRVDPEHGIMDTLVVPIWDFEKAELTASRENSSSSNSVPFTADDSWTFSPLGYIVGGVSTDYRVDLFRVGQPVLRIEREWIPVPVQRDESEERRRQSTENMRRQYPGWQWNGPPIPDTKPPFRGMFVSEEGNVWVLVSQPGTPTMSEAEAREEEQRTGRPQLRFTEPAAYDVFAPDGRFLGHVSVPQSFSNSPEPIVRGGTVWAVTRDELDVASIVRFRIVRSEG